MFLVIETEVTEGDVIRVGEGGNVITIAPDLATDKERNVRRPMRGIRLKRETYATIRVSGGSEASLVNSSARPEETVDGRVNFTSNFLLQSVNETRREKFQPMTTFGATYGFFYGEQPRMLNCSGILLNTADFQWEVEWWANYESAMRGTKLTSRGARVYLTFDDHEVEGYIVGASTDKSANDPYQARLSFQMWVTNVYHMVTPGENRIADRHLNTDTLAGELGAGFGSLEAQREALSGASMTAAVRAANLRSISSAGGTGLLSKLAAAADKVEGFVDGVMNTLDTVKDFLYGRNMVIPAGFAGAESYSGRAVFAPGSGEEALIGSGIGGILQGVGYTEGTQQGSSISVRVPGVITGAASVGRSPFYDNLDEYPARGVGSSAVTKEDLDFIQGGLRDDDDIYTELAEATFREFGYDISNSQGQAASDLERAAGRAAFAVLSYAAMATGVSQAAASLTVGNATAAATS